MPEASSSSQNVRHYGETYEELRIEASINRWLGRATLAGSLGLAAVAVYSAISGEMFFAVVSGTYSGIGAAMSHEMYGDAREAEAAMMTAPHAPGLTEGLN